MRVWVEERTQEVVWREKRAGIGYASKKKGRRLGEYCTRTRVLRVGWMECVFVEKGT